METWVANLGAPIAARGQAFVLGRGDSPVSFVAARDVAAMVDLAVREPGLRGRVVDVAGPEDVTINDFVGLLAAAHGADVPVRHVPLPVVRALAVLLRPVKPTAARILEAAAVMDTAPERTPDEARGRPPGVPTTRLADVIRSAAPTT
jgi:nucleoside-diphosphate-sugar epimerase